MAPHSSTLAWKIPWTEEPGGLQSMGSIRVRHDWVTWLSLFTFMHWRRKWQPTPVFLPGESQGWGSLVGCHLWGRTESDTTEVAVLVNISTHSIKLPSYSVDYSLLCRSFLGWWISLAVIVISPCVRIYVKSSYTPCCLVAKSCLTLLRSREV